MRFYVDNTAVVRGEDATQNHRGPRSTSVLKWDLMKKQDQHPQTTDPNTYSHHVGQITPG